MDGKIYDLLKKIDDIGVIKFGLEKNNRIYLKKLLLDEDFLNENIQKNGGIDVFFNILNNVYQDIFNAKNDLENIKKISDSPEFKTFINQYFGKELEDFEKSRESVVTSFVKKEISDRNFENKIEEVKNSDQNKINEILNKLKNNN